MCVSVAASVGVWLAAGVCADSKRHLLSTCTVEYRIITRRSYVRMLRNEGGTH